MTDLVSRVQIFLASPADVGARRTFVDQLVQELNLTVAGPQKFHLELIRWETHATPGFGEDAQDVINQQLGLGDIFIGVISERLGTPTKRAASGTVEEFERALELWRRTGRPKIWLYFSERAPISPRGKGRSQLKKVLEFRRAVEARGGLYWVVNDDDEFEGVLRRHLTREVVEIGRRLSQNPRLDSKTLAPQPDSMWPAINSIIESRWEAAPRGELVTSVVDLREAMKECQSVFERYQRAKVAQPDEDEGPEDPVLGYAKGHLGHLEGARTGWAQCLARLTQSVEALGRVLEIFSPKTQKLIEGYKNAESLVFIADESLAAAASDLGTTTGISIEFTDLRPSFELALAQLDNFIREHFKPEEVHRASSPRRD